MSACLVGVRCRYDGGHAVNGSLLRDLYSERFLPVCPEVQGGLGIPRLPACFVEDGGPEVLAGKARIKNSHGEDVTRFFLDGAWEALKLARTYRVRLCYLKARSPSCGCVPSSDRPLGVTAALLMKYGFPCREKDTDRDP